MARLMIIKFDSTSLRNLARLRKGILTALLPVAIVTFRAAASTLHDSVVVGDVRAQLLSDSLVRLELRGPEGFENRPTFHVLERKWPGVPFTTVSNASEIIIRAPHYVV